MDTDTIHYMATDVLSFSEGKVDDMHMVLSNIDITIKTNNKFAGKFKHEFGSKIIDAFITLSPKTYSLKHITLKEKRIIKCNSAKHEEYNNALIYNTERTVEECRIKNRR